MKKILIALLIISPALVFAEPLGETRAILTAISGLIQLAIVVVAGIALLVFFWGLAKFILKIGGDTKAVEDGRKMMIWGTIALFVMVSIWGIIYFIGDQIFPGRGNDYYVAPPLPQSPR